MTALEQAKIIAAALPRRGDNDRQNDYFIETLKKGLEEFAKDENFELRETYEHVCDRIEQLKEANTKLDEFVKHQADSLQEAWGEVHKLRERCVAVSKMHDNECKENQELKDELAQLKEANRELLKDKERLDLLLTNKLFRVQVHDRYNNFSHKHIYADLKSREALDKAALAKERTE